METPPTQSDDAVKDAPTPVAAAVNTAPMKNDTAAAPAFSAADFLKHRRIHIMGSSYLGQADEMFLTVHHDDLKPENRGALGARIQKVFTHGEPMWIVAPHRLNLVASLSDMIPPSKLAEQAKFGVSVQDFIQKTTASSTNSGTAPEKESAPFASYISMLMEDKPLRLDQQEALQNGIGMYLLLEKALKDKNLTNLAGPLVQQTHSADTLLAKIQLLSGIDVNALKEAARTGGLAAAGKALGVEDAYIKEVLQLVKQLPDRKFSANAIENWKFGRLQPGMQNAGVHEKIEAGLMPRIHAKINGLIGFFKNQSIDLPAIGELEKEIAGRLQLLPPNVLEAYFRRGGMVIYNPASSLNGRGLLGLNQHTKAHPDDVLGMDLVFVSGGTGADKSQGTLVHEITHTLYPNYLTETDIARTDALALSDKQRLEKLHTLLGQWIKSDKPEEKAALEAQVETGFAVAGVPWSKIRGNADMHSLYTLVNEAWANLTAESPKLILSGYSEPEKRMAEVNSRYADLRFVRYREQPDLLHFVVPGLTESYEQIYLPHIERALSDLRVRQTPKTPLEAAKTSSIVVPNAQATRTLEVGETQSPSMTIDTQGVAHAGMAAAATQNVEASRALH